MSDPNVCPFCDRELPMKPRSRVRLPDVLDKFAAYHRRNRTWGIFHVPLDDGNYKLDCAEPTTDEERELAELFRKLTYTQRVKLSHLA